MNSARGHSENVSSPEAFTLCVECTTGDGVWARRNLELLNRAWKNRIESKTSPPFFFMKNFTYVWGRARCSQLGVVQ